ncbi:phage major capsid protein, partial [Sulfitobacter sp. HI0076]|uniref:phage major capsid protein n=1 Tax=Sulfitobacter sp. HI0076 TaxID=1822251 RepID=UPI0012374913
MRYYNIATNALPCAAVVAQNAKHAVRCLAICPEPPGTRIAVRCDLFPKYNQPFGATRGVQMNRTAIRGIQAVRAQGGTDIKALLEEQGNDFKAFKERHFSEVSELREVVDMQASKIAAMSLNGIDTGVSGAKLTPQAAADFQKFMATGASSGVMEVKAAMQSGQAEDGGASVPKQISNSILNQLVDASPLRKLASVENATTSDYVKIVGLRGASSGWAGETDPRSITTTPKMGEVKPTFGELFAYCEATTWVLEDSQFNLEKWLNENVVDEFALKENAAFFNGDGVDKPTGFLTVPQTEEDDADRAFGTLQTVPAGSATVIEQDDLVNLMMSLRSPYRMRGNCAWIMNRTTAAIVRKMKDADGRLIWSDSLAAGQPATLLGYPVFESEEMD